MVKFLTYDTFCWDWPILRTLKTLKVLKLKEVPQIKNFTNQKAKRPSGARGGAVGRGPPATTFPYYNQKAKRPSGARGGAGGRAPPPKIIQQQLLLLLLLLLLFFTTLKRPAGRPAYIQNSEFTKPPQNSENSVFSK